MDDITITIGLAGLIAICVGGGICVVIWLYSKFAEVEEKIIEAVRAAREAGEKQINELTLQMERLRERQQSHEVHVEKQFISKDTANLVFGRIEKGLDDLRSDVRTLIEKVAKGEGGR